MRVVGIVIGIVKGVWRYFIPLYLLLLLESDVVLQEVESRGQTREGTLQRW